MLQNYFREEVVLHFQISMIYHSIPKIWELKLTRSWSNYQIVGILGFTPESFYQNYFLRVKFQSLEADTSSRDTGDSFQTNN